MTTPDIAPDNHPLAQLILLAANVSLTCSTMRQELDELRADVTPEGWRETTTARLAALEQALEQTQGAADHIFQVLTVRPTGRS